MLVEGGRGHGSVRVLVGVHAGVDRAAVHDVVGGRHLLRTAGGHRGRLQSHLRRRLGQLTHARRSVKFSSRPLSALTQLHCTESRGRI